MPQQATGNRVARRRINGSDLTVGAHHRKRERLKIAHTAALASDVHTQGVGPGGLALGWCQAAPLGRRRGEPAACTGRRDDVQFAF